MSILWLGNRLVNLDNIFTVITDRERRVSTVTMNGGNSFGVNLKDSNYFKKEFTKEQIVILIIGRGYEEIICVLKNINTVDFGDTSIIISGCGNDVFDLTLNRASIPQVKNLIASEYNLLNNRKKILQKLLESNVHLLN